MDVMLEVAMWVLAGLAALILLALSLPLRLELVARKDAAWQVTAVLRPFGQRGPPFTLSGRRRARAPDARARESTSRAQAPKDRSRRAANRVPLGRNGLTLLFDVLGLVRFDDLRLDVRFGLDDPAETGQVYGALMPLVYASAPVRALQIRLTPMFDRAGLTGSALVVLSLVPFTLFGPGLRFAWRMRHET